MHTTKDGIPIIDGLKRIDFDVIVEIVDNNSRVLDLGCAGGELLEFLRNKKNVDARGVEISQEKIAQCIKRGISVFQGNLDEGLKDYSDKSFDYVILSQTLQVVHKPNLVLAEMLRVGKKAIISFPNFAYWEIRFKILFGGRMPKTKILPYEWYNSPNIHLITLKDFREYCKNNGLNIKKEIPINLTRIGKRFLNRLNPNFFSQYGIYLIE